MVADRGRCDSDRSGGSGAVHAATKYSRLPPAQPLPNAKYSEAPFDLRVPSLGLDGDFDFDAKHNKLHYSDLAEVLRAVPPFGFLDKPVLNELAKHLVTRKVRAGTVIFDSDNNNSNSNNNNNADFAIVLDGQVSVFVKPGPTSIGQTTSAFAYANGVSSGSDDSYSSEDEEFQHSKPRISLSGHHLLNQVRRGGVVSSLFSVMSVLTESVNLPQKDLANLQTKSATTPTEDTIAASILSSAIKTQLTNLVINPLLAQNPVDSASTAKQSTISSDETPSIIPSPQPRQSSLHHNISINQSHQLPQITSVAMTDTKLLILPADAFRSLKFAPSLQRRTTAFINSPLHSISSNSTDYNVTLAHVAQVLVARFLRVTVSSMEQYLGLKGELLGIERSLSGGSGANIYLIDDSMVERVRKRVAEIRRFSAVESSLATAESLDGATNGIGSNGLGILDDSGFFNDDGYFGRGGGNMSDAAVGAKSPLYGKSQNFRSNSPGAASRSSNTSYVDAGGVRRRHLSKRSVLEVDASESESGGGEIGYSVPVLFPPSNNASTSPSKRHTMMGLSSPVLRSTKPKNQQQQLYPQHQNQPKQQQSYSDFRIVDNRASIPLPELASGISQSNRPQNSQKQQQQLQPGINTLKSQILPLQAKKSKLITIETPGIILEPETDEDRQLAEAIFNSISLIIGITTQDQPENSNDFAGFQMVKNRASIDSLDSSTDDGTESISGYSATSSDFLVGGVGSGLRFSTNSLGSNNSKRPGSKDIALVSLDRGNVLVNEGDRVSGLWYCVDGILEASVKDLTKSKKKSVFLIKPGNLAGYLAAVTGSKSLVTIKAKTDAQVGFIPRAIVEKYVEKYPNIILTLTKRLLLQISPLAYQVDFALDWGHINASKILYRQGEYSDSIFIILGGRLRSIGEKQHTDYYQNKTSSDNSAGATKTKFEIYGEFGPGESLGELEVLTESRRPSTVHAIRDTEVAILPKTLFNALAIRHPEMTIQISRMLAARSVGMLTVTGMVPSMTGVGGGFGRGVNMNPFGSEDGFNEGMLGLLGGASAGNDGNGSSSNAGGVGTVGGNGGAFTGSANPALTAPRAGATSGGSGADSGKNNFNLKTVGILPVNEMVPIGAFSERLKQGLELVGASVALLNNSAVVGKMGKHVFSTIGRLKLMSWLAEQEDTHRLVLYVADGGIGSQWTQRCIRQADCIFLVGLGDEDPAIGEYERLVLSLGTTARKELILLHNERQCVPGSTAAWLKSRLWIHAHHHVQMPLSSRKILNTYDRKNTLLELQAHFQRFYTQATGRVFNPNARGSPNVHTGIRSDFARIARRLLNKSIGLALGGGGARGISHVAIIRAFEEAGIPIDLISGTSIGSFVGGLYARENDHVSIYGRAKQLSSALGSKWNQAMDITYPMTSLFSGHGLNQAIWKCFRETQIEDCWIPFSAVSVNITDSRVEVHRSGYMWRYVRASMSLAGYFPPICDEGKLLVDGGYLNLVPVDIVESQGAHVVIAVDVSLGYDTSPVTYGDSLSGVWLFFARFFPGMTNATYGQIPLLPDIQDRLAFAGSSDRLEKVKAGEFYLHPPVSKFGAVDFPQYKAIYDIGYKYGKEIVRRWEKDGILERRFGIVKEKTEGVRRGTRRASI
ncbi:phosphatidylcholine and lysophosphatidylcholine phospholipase [Physocladia obscura]|uniref:Lysophospholipase NTE1 n=1 Tax=Physocladia obscura TaxID=109957 RepID=A0AAD5SUT0_9FUNG|nr:phosphatidylcholine and lysophosphatidylcholine phospholipase [Physocladia obscura]